MLTSLLVSLLFAPQEPAAPRLAPIFGFVRTDARRPWVGARVHLLSRPIAQDPDAGQAHEVHTTTDERGNFRALVRAGAIYTVWADSSPGSGSSRVSDTAEYGLAGRPVALTMREAPRSRTPIPVRGLAAWQERGPFTLRVVTDTHHVHFAPVELRDGAFTPPPAPHGRQRLEVFDRTGTPLFDARLASSTNAVEVPPPAQFHLLVRAGFGGKGIAGARVLRRLGTKDHLLGTTDADGELRLTLPAGSSPHDIRVVAAGFRRSFPGRVDGEAGAWICDAEPITARQSVRLLLGEDRPAAGLPVRAVVDVFRKTGKDSGASFQDLLVQSTDPRGRFELDTSRHCLLHVLAPAAFGFDTRALVFLEDAEPRAEYRLDRYRPVRLAVRRADGTPAVGAEVLLGRKPNPSPKVQQPSWAADQRGEVLVLLPPGGPIGVLAMLDGEHGIYEIHLGPDSADGTAQRTVQRLEIPMQEPFWLRGEVVDTDGKPLANSGVFASATQGGFLGELPPAPDATTQGLRLAPFTDPKRLHPFVALALSHRDRFRRRGPEFAYPLPRHPWRYFVNAFEIGGRRGRIVHVEVTGAEGKPVRIEAVTQRR